MENETKPLNGEFFRVSCSKNSLVGKMVRPLYRHYHAITKLNKDDSDRLKKNPKVQYWKNIKKGDIPPNIIFVGLDSTSRLNLRRNMFKTVDALRNLGAIEMFGYTKVGENTYPNMVTAFTGYDEEQLSKSCIESGEKLDECPFIWKRLDEANYLTSHVEDTPRFTIFNYLKTGFIQQPVDFYPRAMFVAAHKDSPDLLNQLNLVTMDDFLHCIGYKLNDEIIIEYVQSLLQMSRESNVPLFSFSWSTLLTHSDNNNAQIADDIYANFISTINQTDNNIFFFLSDHGYRFTEFRETLIGWYEDKLPTLWIYLPERVKEQFPQWEESLIVNSRRLTSPYSLYWTINHILDFFTKSTQIPDIKLRDSGEIISKRYAYSLFDEFPENATCDEVGVPEGYCACYLLQKVETTDKQLQRAAQNALDHINLFLPDGECVNLEVKNITGGAMMDKTSLQTNKRVSYVVTFISDPGDFVFEATIDYFPSKDVFSTKSDVLRTNKINVDHTFCISHYIWEKYCYCKE